MQVPHQSFQTLVRSRAIHARQQFGALLHLVPLAAAVTLAHLRGSQEGRQNHNRTAFQNL